MAKTPSSKRWLQEHNTDPYVKSAKAAGFRSRSAYKLLEINERDRILQPGLVVIELGAAPGGWSQVVMERIVPGGRLIAVDLLAFDSLDGVEFVQGDFSDAAVVETLHNRLGGRKADLVLSDMAPNISGIKAIDQPRSLHLAELASDWANAVLKPGGDLLVKVFQGEGTDCFVKSLLPAFANVRSRKPKASRDRSDEVYVLARNYRL